MEFLKHQSIMTNTLIITFVYVGIAVVRMKTYILNNLTAKLLFYKMWWSKMFRPTNERPVKGTYVLISSCFVSSDVSCFMCRHMTHAAGWVSLLPLLWFTDIHSWSFFPLIYIFGFLPSILMSVVAFSIFCLHPETDRLHDPGVKQNGSQLSGGHAGQMQTRCCL